VFALYVVNLNCFLSAHVCRSQQIKHGSNSLVMTTVITSGIISCVLQESASSSGKKSGKQKRKLRLPWRKKKTEKDEPVLVEAGEFDWWPFLIHRAVLSALPAFGLIMFNGIRL